MAEHLIVVEGAHDAAFFGKLLGARQFEPIQTLPDVPPFWVQAIPRNYPVRSDLALERVVTFPDIHRRMSDDATVGIVVANGDGGLLRSLRDYLDLFEVPDFVSVSLVLDTDWGTTEAERFSNFRAKIDPWNLAAVADGRPGFPLPFPERPGEVQQGAPRLGIYQFPGSGAQGALEDVLLACARHHHPVLHEGAEALLTEAHASYPANADPDPLRASRKPAGGAKATCGIIANVLRPGSSLAVSIRDSSWIPTDEQVLPEIRSAAEFLDALLAP